MKLAPTLLLCTFAATAATTPRSAWSVQPFEALPLPDHTVRATDLAWLDEGLVTGVLSNAPEFSAAVSAPHFQATFGQRALELQDPSTGQRSPTRTERKLRLATALATSQIGLGSESLDFALGAAFHRNKISFDSASPSLVEGNRQALDVSAAVRMGPWRLSGDLLDAVDAGSDSGVGSDPRVSIDLGRAATDVPQFGARFSLPLRVGGEGGLRVGVGRVFREALSFSAEIGTTYRYELDTTVQLRHLVRRSLELDLGAGIRFRPAQPSDPAWIRNLVGTGPQAILRHLRLDVGGSWDLVRGSAGGAVSLGREF